MKVRKSFLYLTASISLIFVLSFIIGKDLIQIQHNTNIYNTPVKDTDFGLFLATQHALYINDFDKANQMLDKIDTKVDLVNNTKDLVDFLNGKMPENIEHFSKETNLSGKLIYDAYLLQNNKWKEVYKRHSTDSSSLLLPLRIFSAVHENKTKEIVKYVKSLKINDSWKSFILGQIAVLNNDLQQATKEFANVHPDFMNINDYLYLMSFYKQNNMQEDMRILHDDFVAKIGGLYVLDFPEIPDWTNYEGYINNMIFSIIQTISHTQIMTVTDLSLLMLRYSQILDIKSNQDSVNFYLGQYYLYNSGDYKSCFNAINTANPLYLIAQFKIAEKNNNIKDIKRLAQNNPLFVPAVNILIKHYLKNGKKTAALHIINKALNTKNINPEGTLYFLKQRASVYITFQDTKKAQQDLQIITQMDTRLTSDILLLQARLWNLQNINLDKAYDYTMTVIKRNTSDIVAWDLLSVIVDKREGPEAALDILKTIATKNVPLSSLYEHIGDLYIKNNDIDMAKKSYIHALELSDDGFIIKPIVKNKLRKIK